jgi:3-oxoacyl-[acyl-carrier-protein] synthase-3
MGALDFSIGCSGFVYGLAMAKGLIESGQARSVLLVTAETYSKILHPADKTTRTIFGDGAAATLIQAGSGAGLGPFVFGTDGSGAKSLIAASGGMRRSAIHNDMPGNDHLFMDGLDLFNFTLRRVPEAVSELLARAGKRIDDVDWFVFHQANRYMLESLRKKIGIPAERFCLALEESGNTVSSTIPIALKQSAIVEKIKAGDTVMVAGFGVGFSWAAALIEWSADFV